MMTRTTMAAAMTTRCATKRAAGRHDDCDKAQALMINDLLWRIGAFDWMGGSLGRVFGACVLFPVLC